VRSRATRGLALCSGVVLNLAGGGLLLWASFLFIFYGYCEDYCDKPERTVAGALGESLPSAVGALALMTAASYVFMEVAGIRFDTSSAQRTGSRWQNERRPTAGFTVRHPPGL
jgi:hypothetical protein